VTSPERAVARRFDPFDGAPRLNGARRVGIRPGTELIHAIAATGGRPLQIEVEGLPEGIDLVDGVLRGVAPDLEGTHTLGVSLSNAHGSVETTIDLVVGRKLALTPPMGWNSWNVYGEDVSAEVILSTAEAMVASGMRDLGYQYVNIDDFWHAEERAADGTPLANPETFPEGIAALADSVHALGLRLGIYSDAGHSTCGGCFGGHGHEEIDARTYAEWGVDLLKYDYCFTPPWRKVAVERYGRMGRALRSSGRSVVFSVCEWGFRRPWTWAPGVDASYWRTTPDIFDTFWWGPGGVRGIAWWNQRLADRAGPGGWNDPDMLLVGNRGRGRSTGIVPAPGHGRDRRALYRFRGLEDEQALSHMTLWAMMAAPLLASHDLSSGGGYDTALLTNPDVLEVNQDPLGIQARRVRGPRGVWVLVKPLVDGGLAVSFTNVGRSARNVSVDLRDHGAPAGSTVLEAWSGEPLGSAGKARVRLGRHRSVLLVARPTE
jgi:alpha-galactosidase